jgi:TonB family protein
MFEFAISQNERRRPTKRRIASWIASCLAHAFLIIILIENPGLLHGGKYHRFRGILSTALFERSTSESVSNDRLVTLLRPMTAPSAETLKKYIYDWNKKGEGPPPVRVRWKENLETSGDEKAAPMPKVKESKSPEIKIPANEVAGSVQGNADSSPDGSSSGSSAVTVQSEAAKKNTIPLPPPSPSGKTDLAANAAPASIPNTKPSAGASTEKKSANSPDAVKVFDNEQQALRKEGTGFFDVPKGFPLGDYANIIIERIKGKWFIPSNLKNSQGHTTVVFFIDKDGRFTDARIIASASSGNNSLDLAALNAIIESDPFPPLPKGFPGDHIGAKFVFSYNEPQ